MGIHDNLLPHLRAGDRIVYLGNYIGYGPQPSEVIDEILTFRRIVLSIPGAIPSDLTYLRGGQEEMWEKLQQLQFAPNPADVLLWMLGNGLSTTLTSYGLSPHDGIIAAQEGIMSLTKWTQKIKDAVRRRKGHEIFMTNLRRASFTAEATDFPMLFVHAGIDPSRTLQDQGDNLWWSKKNFNAIELPFAPYQKVIRGYDPAHNGLHLNCVTATIDGGCGFGGSLICAGFEQNGSIFDMIEA